MNTYIVRPGDTLSAIAKALLGPGATYWDLVSYNPEISDPDAIEVGQEILYPGEAKTIPASETKAPVSLPALTGSKMNLAPFLYGSAALMGLSAIALLLSPKGSEIPGK